MKLIDLKKTKKLPLKPHHQPPSFQLIAQPLFGPCDVRVRKKFTSSGPTSSAHRLPELSSLRRAAASKSEFKVQLKGILKVNRLGRSTFVGNVCLELSHAKMCVEICQGKKASNFTGKNMKTCTWKRKKIEGEAGNRSENCLSSPVFLPLNQP